MENEPLVSVPLSYFLEILWGYRKADLRDRAVPRKEIVKILQTVPGINNYVYIQEQEGCETIVWQKDEWKRSGIPMENRKVEMAKHSDDAAKVYAALKASKIGMLPEEVLRTIAHQIVHLKSTEGLRSLGIEPKDIGL